MTTHAPAYTPPLQSFIKVHGDSVFMIGDFKEFKVEDQVGSSWNQHHVVAKTADYIASVTNMQPSDASFNSLDQGKQGERHVVRGRVYCDLCSSGRLTLFTTFMQGARVGIQCRNSRGNQVLYSEAMTDSNGWFDVNLDGYHEQHVCKAELRSSPDTNCNITTEKSISFVNGSGFEHTMALAFSPLKKPKSCAEMSDLHYEQPPWIFCPYTCPPPSVCSSLSSGPPPPLQGLPAPVSPPPPLQGLPAPVSPPSIPSPPSPSAPPPSSSTPPASPGASTPCNDTPPSSGGRGSGNSPPPSPIPY